MQVLEICIIGIGLAMDALAVSICKGLAIKKISYKACFIVALYFGLFQGVMPIFGYVLGKAFSSFVESIDHWVAFIILAFIGINMIKESFEEDKNINDALDYKTMTMLAIATSIDALTVGVTFAFFKVNLLFACLLIFLITFVLCFLGVKIGNTFGNRLKIKPDLIGGITLILIGLKILLEHLNIISF